VIQLIVMVIPAKKLDCRVKPGNDAVGVGSAKERTGLQSGKNRSKISAAEAPP